MRHFNTGVKLKEFDNLADEFDFIFNNYFRSHRSVMMPVKRGWKPSTDVYETEAEIVIIVDIACIERRDIKVRLEGNQLILQGIRREHSPMVKRDYHKMEIDFGPFERRIKLPSSIETDKVTTNYKQGFLEIHLPKRSQPGPSRIEIEFEIE